MGQPVVYVACKMPNGIVLRGNSGSKKLDPPPRRTPGDQNPPGVMIVAGFSITEVPKALWDEWLRANWNSDMVLNRLIFGHADRNECVGMCWQNKRVRSGLEPARQG